MLLVHGFDISCLEYRRLLPLLEAEGVEAYAPCVPGWGFTDTANMRSVGVEAKRAALLAFHEQVLDGRPAIWVGASLGACMCLDAYIARPAAVAKLASLDPGFFTPAPPAVNCNSTCGLTSSQLTPSASLHSKSASPNTVCVTRS